jgi:hypothetical protein
MIRPIDTEKFLERATALAIAARDLEMLDRVTILRGYAGLRTLLQDNASVERRFNDVLNSLMSAARNDEQWALLEQEMEGWTSELAKLHASAQ